MLVSGVCTVGKVFEELLTLELDVCVIMLYV